MKKGMLEMVGMWTYKPESIRIRLHGNDASQSALILRWWLLGPQRCWFSSARQDWKHCGVCSLKWANPTFISRLTSIRPIASTSYRRIDTQTVIDGTFSSLLLFNHFMPPESIVLDGYGLFASDLTSFACSQRTWSVE